MHWASASAASASLLRLGLGFVDALLGLTVCRRLCGGDARVGGLLQLLDLGGSSSTFTLDVGRDPVGFLAGSADALGGGLLGSLELGRADLALCGLVGTQSAR